MAARLRPWIPAFAGVMVGQESRGGGLWRMFAGGLMIEEFAGLIPESLLGVSGKAFYSGGIAFGGRRLCISSG